MQPESAPAARVKRSLPELTHPAAPLVMVTAYDYPGARHAEAAGVDLILVGDSLGNVVLGYDSTAPVTLGDMRPSPYAAEVRAREFPSKEHSFVMKDEVIDKLY